MDLVTIASYSTSAAAMVARNYLASEGISAFVEGAVTGDILPIAGEVKLQVAAEDAERAMQLVREAESRIAEEPEESEGDEAEGPEDEA